MIFVQLSGADTIVWSYYRWENIIVVQRDAWGMLVKLGFTWVHLVQKPVTTNMSNEYILETKFIVQDFGIDFDKAGSM